MKKQPIFLIMIATISMMISACGGAAPTEMSHAKPASTDEMMMHETPTGEATMGNETPGSDTMMGTPAWYSASLHEVTTGETFSVDSLKGKVVLVESMAVWCPTCLAQQKQIKALRDSLGQQNDFVSISLDIDPNEDAEQLKSYVSLHGFDWLYAVSSPDVSRNLSSLYGDQFLNPPSTPIVVVDRHGEAHVTPFGLKSADDLLKFIQPFLNDSM